MSRFKNILNYRKPGFWLGMLSVVLAAGAVFILFAKSKEKTETISVIGGADGPTSIFLAGKMVEDEGKEGDLAVRLDVEQAKEEPFGMAAELDWVSADKISIHGSFGYLSFDLTDLGRDGTADLNTAFTLEEAGTIIMQGDGYTEVLGGKDSLVVITNAYDEKAESQWLWYLEKSERIQPIEEELIEINKKEKEQGLFGDAVLAEEYLEQVSEKVAENPESHLIYGPVEIPEFDSIVCGFLAADGEKLEDLWYGIWYKLDGRIEKIPLF